MVMAHRDLAVSLQSISRAFGSVPAVSRVSMVIERGETVLVRGPNGAGKSTLLRIIATALSPTAGRGEVLGFDLLSKREEIRRRTELVSHRTRLYEDLTAFENLRFAAVMHGIDPRRVPGALDEAGLAGVARERVRGFSNGMRQRLALARALLRASELLLLDEPYAGLDREARELVDRLVIEGQQAGRTAVIVTHDVTRGQLANRVVVMRGGRIFARAPSADAAGAERAEAARA